MRKSRSLLGIFLAVLLGCGLVWSPWPAAAASERILSFNSLITVHPDATLTVTENITVISTGNEIRRGIVRDFPTTYTNRHGRIVRVGFEIVEIRRDGRIESYHTQTVANGVKIFIGQQNVFLSPGQYTYTITYRTTRQVGFFQDFDELYWNVTGTGWTFSIDAASALVQLPPGAGVVQYAAYTGPYGARGQDFRVKQDAPGNIFFTTTRGLAPREGLTIAVAWPKGLVREPSRGERTSDFIQDLIIAYPGPLAGGFLLLYHLAVWYRVGRDPGEGVIIPLFAPPAGISPAAARMLMRLSFDNKTLTAAILNMAVKGYLRITETGDDFTLVRTKAGKGGLTREEDRLSEELFGRTDIKHLSSTSDAAFRSGRAALQASLENQLHDVHFKLNTLYLAPGSVIAIFILGLSFFLTGSLSLSLIAGIGIVVLLNALFIYLIKAPTVQGRRVMDQLEGFKLYLATAEQERLNFLHPPDNTPELFEKFLPYALALDVENEWTEQFNEVLSKAGADGKPYSPSWYSGTSWGRTTPARFTGSLGASLTSTIAAAASPPGSSSGSGGGGSSGGGGGGGGGSGW